MKRGRLTRRIGPTSVPGGDENDRRSHVDPFKEAKVNEIIRDIKGNRKIRRDHDEFHRIFGEVIPCNKARSFTIYVVDAVHSISPVG